MNASPGRITLPISKETLRVVGIFSVAGLICGLTSFLLIWRFNKRGGKRSEGTGCEEVSDSEVKEEKVAEKFSDGIDLRMPMHQPIKNAILSGPIYRIQNDGKSASAPVSPRIRFESRNSTDLDQLDMSRRIATIAVTRSESADDAFVTLRNKYYRDQSREEKNREGPIFDWKTKGSRSEEGGDLVPINIRRSSTNPVFCEAEDQKAAKSPRHHQGAYNGLIEYPKPSCPAAVRDQGFLNPLFSDDSGDIGPELPAMDLNLAINTTEPHEFDQGGAPCLPGIMSPMDSQGHSAPRFGSK